jgi:uncharacterized protein
MHHRVWVIAACLAFGGAASANDAPASDESIRQLLEITDARHLIDTVRSQVNDMVSASLQQAQQDAPLNPQKQAILNDMRKKMLGAMDEMLNWDTLLPMYMRTYRESFTQDELDGITAFYKSTAGQAFVKKMPLVMRNMMGEIQALMKPMREKLLAIQRDTQQQLKSLQPQQPAPAGP